MTSIPDEWKYKREDGAEDYRAFPPLDGGNLTLAQLSDAKAFTRILLSTRDFADAEAFLSFLPHDVGSSRALTLDESRRHRCYETAFVVAYARPFGRSRKRKNELDFLELLGVAVPLFTRLLHAKILRKRNQVFAHSDLGKVSFTAVPISGQNKTGMPYDFIRELRFNQGLELNEEEVIRARILTWNLLEAVQAVLHRMYPFHKELLNYLQSREARQG